MKVFNKWVVPLSIYHTGKVHVYKFEGLNSLNDLHSIQFLLMFHYYLAII